MGEEFITLIVAEADELARRLREWNERFLEVQLVAQERTIDVRVEELSEVLAAQKTAYRLQANREWMNKVEQIRSWLDWLGGRLGQTADNGLFLIALIAVAAGLGWWGGINTPDSIVCSTRTSLCFSARVWGLKTARTDQPVQCTQTRSGLMCLIEPAPHSKPKSSAGKSKQKSR